MTKDREKAIKLYWNIAKERCPFHEEEMVNSFLEGFIDCAEYLLLQNAELEKEVLEVRQHLDLTEREWGKDTNKLIHYKTQFTKAKDMIKELYEGLDKLYLSGLSDKQITFVEQLQDKAEQFIKDSEVENV